MTQALDLHLGQDAWPVPSLRRIAIASVVTVVCGIGGLLLWASLMPLDSAVNAQGLFVAAGKRKTVTLLDSGILHQLLVSEGQHVAAGQPLLTLEDVQLRTAMNQAKAQYWGAVAKAARLTAETQDERQLNMPETITQAASKDKTIAELMQAEENLFASRWDTFDGNARVSGRKIAQLQSQITSLQVQIDTLKQRLLITQQETKTVEYLQSRGLDTKSHLLDMRRSVAELQGALADADGRYAAAEQAIEQTKFEFANFAETRRSDSSKDLQEAQGAMADAVQRLRSTEDLLSRHTVLAPEEGTITDIKAFTPGSSITAGQPVMDIVPADRRLLVEAPVAPTDIEHVHVGQRVNFRLSAYKAHRVPTVEGRLVYVAADRTLDPQNNPVFLVRAELDPEALKPFPGVNVYAGMPADLLIIGGERSALDFIISPILDGMRHGMREE